MIGTFMLAVVVAAHQGPLPGADKVKHFFVSAFVQSVSFSVARAAGMNRADAQLAGSISTMTIGIAKELNDWRVGRSFSTPDLGWDALGALTAAAILNGTR